MGVKYVEYDGIVYEVHSSCFGLFSDQKRVWDEKKVKALRKAGVIEKK